MKTMNPQTASQINGPQVGEVGVPQEKTRYDIVPRYVVDDLQAQLTAAQKACAEMRRALERIRFVNPMSEKSIADQLNENVALWYHALSADCGKDYIHKSELDQAKADAYELGQRLRNAELVLADFGYQRCNIPACNYIARDKVRPLVEALRSIYKSGTIHMKVAWQQAYQVEEALAHAKELGL